ncbi:MAG: cation-translocating P-type ATPase [Tissierellia bacterium]|nr:cation-translocating P-type ATPase [Tissierellia bacterium]
MKKIMDFLFGIPMTVLSGGFLLWSLFLLLTHRTLGIDPAWGAIIISGIPMLYLALSRLFFEKWISSALLISMAMLASIAIGEVFAAGEVAFIMALGAILEDMTVAKAKKGLTHLIALAPEEGRLIDCGKEKMIPVKEIKAGDVLRVLPGEKIPVDGIVISGNTSVDQSIMTGESLPVDKSQGDEVFCGTINRFGTMDFKATNVGEDSSLQKMIRLVQDAEDKKAPMERIADKWAVWLVPIALFIAIGGFFMTKAMGYETREALTRGVTVLVVFCPCALALATPTSVMAAIGQGTKKGVIIKSGEALETMGKVDTITFDKTGTLTFGEPQISNLLPVPGIDENKLLEVTMNVESKSEHPLAKAILKEGEKRKLLREEPSDFEMIPGKGIQGRLRGNVISCGSKRFLEELGVSIPMEKEIQKIIEEGKAIIYVAENQNYLGAIGLSDTLRPEAKQMIQDLKDMDTRTVLLTGDHQNTANHLGKLIGLTEVFGDLLPEEKVTKIKELEDSQRIICMIGDGVNDAPALKTANVGVAMGSMGSDIAVEAADIALMSDDLSNVSYLKRLSQSTVKTIKGNIILSMAINAIAIALSVMGVLTPVTGALVHNGGSVLVVLNAAMLYDRKFD